MLKIVSTYDQKRDFPQKMLKIVSAYDQKQDML